MDGDARFAAIVVRDVLAGILPPDGDGWQVVTAEPQPYRSVLVTVGRLVPDGRQWAESFVLDLSLTAPYGDAVLAVASQAQDAVIGSAAHWGRALPACPGHRHPMTPGLVREVPAWVCPETTRAVPAVTTATHRAGLHRESTR